MSQEPLALPKSVSGSKSLEKLHLYIISRGSVITAENYVNATLRFAAWAGVPPDKLLARKRDWGAMLNDYVTDAVQQGKSARVIDMVISGTKKWLLVNRAASKADFDMVEGPRVVPIEEQRTPTREELQKILASASLEDKVAALIAIGTGLRVRAISNLRFRHLLGLELKRTGKEFDTRRCEKNPYGHYEMVKVRFGEVELAQAKELPVVRISEEFNKVHRAHFTFLTPECAQVLRAYVKERQVRGEELTPESFVLVNVRGKGQMDIKTVERRWRSILSRAGLDERSGTGRVRWTKLHFHTLRSYFTTQCILAGIEETIVSFFRGDRGGVIQGYFLKGNGEEIPEEVLKVAETKYRKALASLSIMGDSEKVKELEHRVQEHRTRTEADYETLATKTRNLEAKFGRLVELLEKGAKVDPELLRLSSGDLGQAAGSSD